MSINTISRNLLAESLTERFDTQTVAHNILGLDVAETFPEQLKTDLQLLAAEANHGMNLKFASVDDAASQLRILNTLFPGVVSIEIALNTDVYNRAYVPALKSVLSDLEVWLGLAEGVTVEDALTNRLENKDAWKGSLASSKKAYLKRLRAAVSFSEKIYRVEKAVNSRNGMMTAKSRLAREVNPDRLNDIALAYVAYVAARANRRTVFTLKTQSKAFDNIVDGLYKLLPEDTNWDEVVLVSPVESLIRRMPAEQIAEFVSRFYNEMVHWAGQLEKEWHLLKSDVQKSGIVSYGTNSTDVNAFAGAYNTMRSAWIAAMTVAGLTGVFEAFLPGKAVRLLAADLVRWNSYEGGAVSLDFSLFQALPYPWEVIAGDYKVTRSDIVAAGILPEKELNSTGWLSPRTGLELEVAKADPALVHGVMVANPAFASALRKAGVFSAKGVKWDVLITELLG